MMCETFGISRQAWYAARQRRNGRRKQRSSPVAGAAAGGGKDGRQRPEWASTEQLREAIHEIVRAHPAWGVRKVWATLRRRRLRAGCKRVWAIMRADGLTMQPVSVREAPARYGHVAVPESNRRWATDLTTVWTREDGVVAVAPVIDCGDRVVLSCAVTKIQNADAILAPVREALEDQFGSGQSVPPGLELRSDHGPQYTGADCRELCDEWGLEHTFAPIGRPTGNGVVERFILTLKIELIWTRDWASADELRDAVPRWLDEYHDDRPHQALNWLTPREKRAANLGLPLDTAA